MFPSKDCDKKSKRNVNAQMHAITASYLFESSEQQRGLFNPFTNRRAHDQKHHDLLNFRIGQQEYLLRISYFILKNPSVKTPNRKRSLQTFSTKQVNRKRVHQLERDRQLVLSAMKKKIQFSQKTGRENNFWYIHYQFVTAMAIP